MISPDEIITLAVTGMGTVTVPIALFLWSNRITVKRELAEREQRNQQRHEENLARFNKLLTDRQYYPPHGHSETEGPLQAEGIRVSPIKINGGN